MLILSINVISVLTFFCFLVYFILIYCSDGISVYLTCLSFLSVILPVSVMCILQDQQLCCSSQYSVTVQCIQDPLSSLWIAAIDLAHIIVCSLGASLFLIRLPCLSFNALQIFNHNHVTLVCIDS